MTYVTFRCASSLEECKGAFDLAKKIFKDNDQSKLKKLNWQYFGIDEPKNIIIGLSQDKIVGVLRICPLKMKIKGQILKVAGLSSICIDPNFQGYGFGKELMERSIIYLDQRGYDLSFLIARRAVDRFYTKFGYFGASSYQSLNLNCSQQLMRHNSKIFYSEFNLNNSEKYLEFFQQSYENCFGACYRKADFWEFSIKKLSIMGLSFKEILLNDILVGYVVYNEEEEVLECGFDNDIDPLIIKQSLMSQFSKRSNINMFIPHNHRVTKSFDDDDVEYYSRQCFYGGHMLRWSPQVDPIPISIGKADEEKYPIFFNIPLLDQV
jgi:predicted acetyltransferase